MALNQTPQNQTSRRGEAGQNIQVYVRVRPLNSDERNARSSSVVSCPTQREVSVQEKLTSHITKTFNFDRVFCDISKQTEVYKSVVHPLIKQVLQGYNCTVFAYGQTGTGKTYTMEGLKDFDGAWESDPDAGIIPRSLVDIFNARDKGGFHEDTFQIKVSFLELYNEEIFDLLCKNLELDRKHKIFEDSAKKGSVIVQGLEERVVKSKESVLKILEEGSMKRQTAATKMNATSSRSHTIFTITVTITEKSIVGQEKYIEGKLNLVDLAGSENIGRSGAVDKRAREAGKINESLLTLGRVINALVKRENHVPYRESKLTRLLQDSLGGRTKTSIIATISPASINVEETLSTLDYAHRAKNITNRPEVNQKIPVASKLAEMQAKVDQIRKELEDQRERDGGVFMSQEKKDEMEKKIVELEQLKKEFANLTNLFDLKTAENDRLNEELSDTLRQLEEKSAILSKTQEEKEVQEHLVLRHVDTEEKLTKQAFELREVADQQYTDLHKLQDVRERKSRVEDMNTQSAILYQKESHDRYNELNKLLEARSDTTDKMCSAFRDRSSSMVDKSQAMMQQSVLEWAKTNGETKDLMAKIDSVSATYAHKEQKFFADMLKEAQTLKDDEMVKLQNHLTSYLNSAQEQATAVKKLEQTNEMVETTVKQYLEQAKAQQLIHAKRRKDMIKQSTEKQEYRIAQSVEACNKMKEEIQELKSISKSYKVERDTVVQTIQQLQSVVDGLDSKMEKVDIRINEMTAKLLESMKEVDLALEIALAAEKSLNQLEQTERLALEEETEKMTNEMNDQYRDQVETTTQLLKNNTTGCDAETDFITGCQEREKSRFEKMEVEMRAKSDEAPDHLAKVQDISRATQKVNSETLTKFERLTEAHGSDLLRWREDGDKETDMYCDEISTFDKKAIETLEEAKKSENKFFREDLKKDVPSGTTPARRSERSYPREIVIGTPDDERIRRYRQSRDLGVAMRLQIDEGDSLEEDDSVISGSTNVTESDFKAKYNESSGTSNERLKNGSTSNLSLESEEVGYASDRENRDPKFAYPGSKLKKPKVYPTSTSAHRSRSSSRTRAARAALGSSN